MRHAKKEDLERFSEYSDHNDNMNEIQRACNAIAISGQTKLSRRRRYPIDEFDITKVPLYVSSVSFDRSLNDKNIYAIWLDDYGRTFSVNQNIDGSLPDILKNENMAGTMYWIHEHRFKKNIKEYVLKRNIRSILFMIIDGKRYVGYKKNNEDLRRV